MPDRHGSARVALLTSSLYTGGLERIVHDLALSLRDRGYQAEVFVTRGLGTYAEWLERRGVPVRDCRERPPRIPGLPIRLLRQLRRFRPDIIHGHSGTWLPCSVARLVLRTPRLVFTDHGRYLPEPRYRALVERGFFYRQTDELVAVSGDLANYLQHFLELPAPPDVIPNGIDLAPFAESDPDRRRALRAEWGVSPDEVLAVAVGRLEPVKSHANLLEAVAAAGRDAPQLRLAIIGGGSLDAPLRRRAESADLRGRAMLLGERTDIPDCLGAADVFVIASDSEGLPVSLLEAMAARLPVLATSVGDVPKVLGSPPAGILVPPRDPTSLAEALVRLVADPSQRTRLGRLATERAQCYSLDACVDEYCDLYERVLASRAPSGQRNG